MQAEGPRDLLPRAVVEPPVLEAVVDAEALGRPQVPDESLFILGVEVSLFCLEQLEQREVLPVGGRGRVDRGGRDRRGAASQLCLLKTTPRSRDVSNSDIEK